MQILFILKPRTKSKTLIFGPIALAISFLLITFLGLMIFYIGNIYSSNITRDSLASLYIETKPFWNQEIEIQQRMLDTARENAEKSLDALATRLSKLQAHVMRLDALGSRLADMANLYEIEFDTEYPLGVGGPKLLKMQDSMKISDFIHSLEELDFKIKDRSEKLAAMESILIDRTLQNKTLPEGNPTIDGWISSPFGMRTDPITGKIEFHGGVDYAGKSGSPVLAVASGIVTWSNERHGYGHMVEINHGNGYQTRYAHNKQNLVSIGQKVEKGQVIALIGSSGRTTGPHVHFEVINNGKIVNPKEINSLN